MSKSYTPPDRSTYDPGWNDPPPMPTADPAAKPNRTKLNLNKRVAFPMQGGAPATAPNVKTTAEGLPLPFSTAKYQPQETIPSAPQTQSVLPPPPLASNQAPASESLLPPPPMTAATSENITSESQQLSIELSSDDMHALCRKIFSMLADKMTATEELSRLHEIQKRLDIFNKMWTENKFSEVVQRKLYDIAKALENNEIAAAKEKHRLLVVNHMTECSQWGSALRQLMLLVDDAPSSSADADAAIVLPDVNSGNQVQLLNINAMPSVLDGSDTLPAGDSGFFMATTSSDSTPAQVSINKLSESVSNTTKPKSNTTKPKSGRFGRILHL